MTIFRNSKNQSQCIMTIFRNSKNQSAFYDHIWFYVLVYQYKGVEISLGQAQCTRTNLKNTRFVKIDKKRLNVALAVFDAVKSRFPETNEFIDDTLREECEKEKITADEVIFLQV